MKVRSGEMRLPPRPEELRRGLCGCASHCPSSAYHERACCHEVWCRCSCHEAEYRALWAARSAGASSEEAACEDVPRESLG
jgi:hypothetical protein